MTQTQKRPVLPEVPMSSNAFRKAYEKAQSNHEHVGWPIQNVPREETIIEFLSSAVEMVSADLATGDDCTYELQWIAGLLTGWLRRS
jgi:hypothetical protein